MEWIWVVIKLFEMVWVWIPLIALIAIVTTHVYTVFVGNRRYARSQHCVNPRSPRTPYDWQEKPSRADARQTDVVFIEAQTASDAVSSSDSYSASSMSFKET